MTSKTEKATTLAIAMALIPWAIQQVLAGNTYAGGAAFLIGLGALYAYEHLNIQQIPASAEDFKDVSEAVGDAVEDTVDEHTNTDSS